MTAISRIECSRRHSLRCVVFPVPGDAPGVPTIIAVLNPGSFVPHIIRSPLRNIVLPDSGHGSEAARAGSGGLLAAILACVGCLIVYFRWLARWRKYRERQPGRACYWSPRCETAAILFVSISEESAAVP
jgi:hypothetical protein